MTLYVIVLHEKLHVWSGHTEITIKYFQQTKIKSSRKDLLITETVKRLEQQLIVIILNVNRRQL